MLKSINRGNVKYCRSLNRSSLRILTQVVTGHSTLNAHLYRMKVVSDPSCPKCLVEDEDRDHFLCRCEGYRELRERVFEVPVLEPEDLSNIPLSGILEFIKLSLRFSLKERDTAP